MRRNAVCGGRGENRRGHRGKCVGNGCKNTDFVFCSGDAIAWGGSYSFWDQFTKIPSIKKYMWGNVLGNHDFMSRAYQKNTSEYFKEVHYFPENSYEGEFGVSYFFKYLDEQNPVY